MCYAGYYYCYTYKQEPRSGLTVYTCCELLLQSYAHNNMHCLFQSSSFPVDQIDIHRLVQRATAAVTPLLDKLYKKALQSHFLVNDPTVSKYDHRFRLQNAVRLLR